MAYSIFPERRATDLAERTVLTETQARVQALVEAGHDDAAVAAELDLSEAEVTARRREIRRQVERASRTVDLLGQLAEGRDATDERSHPMPGREHAPVADVTARVRGEPGEASFEVVGSELGHHTLVPELFAAVDEGLASMPNAVCVTMGRSGVFLP